MSHAIARATRLARAALALAALVLAGAACASRAGRPAGGEIVVPDSVIVRVANRHERALVLSLTRPGSETPLGEVAAGGEGRFALRAAAVRGMALELVAVANRESVRTVPFGARGGQVVWLEIMPGLGGSRVHVRWWDEGPPRRNWPR